MNISWITVIDAENETAICDIIAFFINLYSNNTKKKMTHDMTKRVQLRYYCLLEVLHSRSQI